VQGAELGPMRPKLTTIRCPFSAARCRHVHTEPSTTFTCEGSCLRISVTCVRTCGSVNADTQERCMCRGMHTGERGDNIIMSRKGISARAPEQRERARPRLRMAHAPRCTWYSHRTMRREAQDGKSTPNADRHGTPTPPHSNTLLHEITARATSISARAAAATQQRDRARPRSRMARPALHLVQPPHDASGASRPAPCFDASGASSPHISPADRTPWGRVATRFVFALSERSCGEILNDLNVLYTCAGCTRGAACRGARAGSEAARRLVRTGISARAPCARGTHGTARTQRPGGGARTRGIRPAGLHARAPGAPRPARHAAASRGRPTLLRIARTRLFHRTEISNPLDLCAQRARVRSGERHSPVSGKRAERTHGGK